MGCLYSLKRQVIDTQGKFCPVFWPFANKTWFKISRNSIPANQFRALK